MDATCTETVAKKWKIRRNPDALSMAARYVSPMAGAFRSCHALYRINYNRMARNSPVNPPRLAAKRSPHELVRNINTRDIAAKYRKCRGYLLGGPIAPRFSDKGSLKSPRGCIHTYIRSVRAAQQRHGSKVERKESRVRKEQSRSRSATEERTAVNGVLPTPSDIRSSNLSRLTEISSMELYGRISFSSLLCLLVSVLAASLASSVPVGINYGQIADNLPSPEAVIPLLNSIGVCKVKLYDADPRVLQAFAGTGVEFVVCLANECLSRVRDPSRSMAWIKSNILPYIPATKITTITVGNEILTSNDRGMVDDLLPAMQSMQAALQTLGLSKQISITTAHSLAVLETSYPPSAGAFRPDLVPYISPILSFHAKTGSQFLINAYPYFAYKANPKQVPLDFVLFQPNKGVVDPLSNLKYDNMLFAQIDAVYSAVTKLGYGRVRVQISETGWPSKGDKDEAGATVDNARKYNGNLMKVMTEAKGTPMRPKDELDVYVFALFNENLKPGPTSERNYGLFKPDGTPAYQLAVGSVNNTSVGGGSSGGNGDNGTSSGGAITPSPDGSTTGYFTISSAKGMSQQIGGLIKINGTPKEVIIFL
ncbi:hypothetical protein ACLOJK_006327 [Asimina triloba]